MRRKYVVRSTANPAIERGRYFTQDAAASALVRMARLSGRKNAWEIAEIVRTVKEYRVIA